MMHIRRFGWILCLVVLTAVPVSAGVEDWGFRGSLGLDYWYVDWDRSGFPETSTGLWGPRGAVGYGPFSLSVGYMTGTFDAPIYQGDWDREDWDFTFSWNFHRYGSLFVGQKQVTAELTTATWNQEETYSSPYIGVSGFYPIPRTPVFVYASGSYLVNPSIEQRTTATIKEDAEGFNLEGGVGASVPRAPVTLLLGYRHNELKPEKSSSALYDNTFAGPIFGVVWRAK